MHTLWRRTATGLFLFGISFGYVEAAVVVYLRTIYEPIRLRVNPNRTPGDLFPLMTYAQLRDAAPERVGLVDVEVVREAATLLMLAGIALVAAGRRKFWLPAEGEESASAASQLDRADFAERMVNGRLKWPPRRFCH